MIRFKALNCLASEKDREEIIQDLKLFLELTGIKSVTIDPQDKKIDFFEFPILL